MICFEDTLPDVYRRFVKAGARIKEIPFFFLDRTRGESKLSWKIGLEALWIVWWLRIAHFFGRL